MNCKKIFALLLSLCMVLSSFVAVSAAEQVYNVGTSYEEWSSSANSDVDGLYYGTYNSQITAGPVDVEGRTGVHKMTAAIAGTTAGGVFYMPLKNEKGEVISGATLPKHGTLTYSVDLMAPVADDASSAVITIRGGAADLSTPTASDEKTLKNNFGLVSNEWKTINGTVDLATTTYAGTSGAVYVIVRGNLKTVGAELYADNFTWAINARDYKGEVHTRISTADIIGGTDITVTSAPSPTDATKTVVKASGKLNGAYSVVGSPLKDLSGNAIRTLKKGDVIRWEIKMYSTVGYSIVNPGNATPGLMFRKGNWTASGSAGPANSSHYNLAQAQAIPANEWVTIKGATVLNDTIKTVLDYTTNDNNNLNVFLRAAWGEAGDIYFEKFDVTVEKAVTQVVEAGWAAPDYAISHTLARGAAVSAVTNGTFTATLKEIAEFTRKTYPNEPNRWGENCGYQEWVKIIPDKEIPAGRDLKITYDLTTEGILDKNGAPVSNITVRGRFFKAANRTEVSSQYRPYLSVAANTGEPVRVVMDIPGDSYSEALNFIGIAVSLTDNVKTNDYADSDAYFTISNITIEYTEPALSFSADGESLVVENTSDSKYRFSGRLLAAEYMTDDVPELLQFKEIDLSDVEVAAGGEETIAINFAKAVEGTVKLFLWEPGSFTPFVTVE